MKRGQEEAPIELLIGVTILTFVIIIGMYVFNSSCSSQQEQKMRASFSKFARDMELVYFGSTGTSQITRLDFTQASGCSEWQIDSIRISRGPEGTCLAQLGRDKCLVLAAIGSPKYPSTAKTTMLLEVLDISPETSIINDVGSCAAVDMKDIEYDPQDTTLSECWFSSQYYTIRIVKDDSNRIVLQDI